MKLNPIVGAVTVVIVGQLVALAAILHDIPTEAWTLAFTAVGGFYGAVIPASRIPASAPPDAVDADAQGRHEA